MSFQVLACGFTDMGLVRENNEDSFVLLPELKFYALADGMGGHLAGEVASHEATSKIAQLVKDQMMDGKPRSLEEIIDFTKKAIEKVNDVVYRHGRSSQQLRGMGTTLCCVQFHQNSVIYSHVGDSRIYRLRHGVLEQLTNDDTLLRELIDLGQLQEQQIQEFSYRHILTKAVGTEPAIYPSVASVEVLVNDIFLMCTDGLSDLLSREEIEKIINLSPTIDEAGRNLVIAAVNHGGHDNITVVLVHAQSTL